MDVRTGFFYGDIEEEIYIQKPAGFINAIFPNYSCLLKNALYGTRQGPRIWYRTLAEFLTSCGFFLMSANLSVFAKRGSFWLYILMICYLLEHPNQRYKTSKTLFKNASECWTLTLPLIIWE